MDVEPSVQPLSEHACRSVAVPDGSCGEAGPGSKQQQQQQSTRAPAGCPCGRLLPDEDLVVHMMDVHRLPAYIAVSLLGAEFVRARRPGPDHQVDLAPCQLPFR